MGEYLGFSPFDSSMGYFEVNIEYPISEYPYEQIDWCCSKMIKHAFFMGEDYFDYDDDIVTRTFSFKDQADAAKFKLFWG